MLFRKKIEPQCAYCAFGKKMYGGTIACVKNGVMSEYDFCKRFKYNPYAREPEIRHQIQSKLDDKLFDMDGESDQWIAE